MTETIKTPSSFDELLVRPEYRFFKTEPRLKGLCYVTVSGSRAYGTNVESSDLDVRGVVVEDSDDLFLGRPLDTFENHATDTVVYGLRKLVSLLCDCNPSVVELFGTKEEHVLYCDNVGRKLRDNIGLFLSKRAFHSFAGYATQQLRRLQNALAHDSYPKEDKEKHIRASIENMMYALKNQYDLAGGEFVFDTVGNGDDTEVVVTVRADKMPLRKFSAVNASLHTMVRNYDKLNHRNRKKDDAHLRKHAMHLVRLYLEGSEILRGEGIHTYREDDLSLLRKIRSGEVPIGDVFDMVGELEAKINEAYKTSPLPDAPNRAKVDEFLLSVYRNKV